MVVQLDVQGRLLLETQFPAGLVPEAVAVGLDERCLDAVHHDDAAGGQVPEHLGQNLFQPSTVPPDEDGVGEPLPQPLPQGKGRFKEIADVHPDARRPVPPHVLVDDGFAFRTNLEGLYLQMWKQPTGLNGDAARAETDVPEHVPPGEVEGLECQEANGHLRYHLLATVQ